MVELSSVIAAALVVSIEPLVLRGAGRVSHSCVLVLSSRDSGPGRTLRVEFGCSIFSPVPPSSATAAAPAVPGDVALFRASR